MANKYRNEYDAVINGVTYKLRATFENMVAIEEATESSLPQLAKSFQSGNIKSNYLVGIVKAASNEKVDINELQDNIVQFGFINTALALSEFFAAALYGVPDEKKQ